MSLNLERLSEVNLMNYTAAAEKWIEQKIDYDMKTICVHILNYVKPVSIFLIGSFGRGEGSIIQDSQNILPLRDYDILLVMDKKLPPHDLNQIADEINSSLGHSKLVGQEIPVFSVSLTQIALDDLLHWNDIKVLELRLASRLLYGEDVRKKLEVSTESLPLSSGARFLFNSILGLIGVFRTEYLKKPPIGYEKVNLIYECGKMYIEMGTILCLIGKNYSPKYGERSKIIAQNLKREFPDLLKKRPALDKKIEFFTNLKLFPKSDLFDQIEPVALWFETRNDLEAVMKHFMSQYLQISDDNLVNFCDACFRKMSETYLNDVMLFYLDQKYGISSKIILRLASFAFKHLMGLKYMVHLYRKEGMITLSALKEFPILRIFTCAPLLLYSLRVDSSNERMVFDAFITRFKKVYPSKEGQCWNWDEAKSYLLKTYHLYFDSCGVL